MRFGTKIFGKCKNVGRKTCATDGYSEGLNKISVNLVSSNVIVECIADFQHLTFNLDVAVVNERQDATYSGIEVGKKSGCNLGILGINIGSINTKVQQYASR